MNIVGTRLHIMCAVRRYKRVPAPVNMRQPQFGRKLTKGLKWYILFYLEHRILIIKLMLGVFVKPVGWMESFS